MTRILFFPLLQSFSLETFWDYCYYFPEEGGEREGNAEAAFRPLGLADGLTLSVVFAVCSLNQIFFFFL